MLQTPQAWTKVWSGPQGAIQYLQAVMDRVGVLDTLKEGCPTSIDLAAMFHPDVFFGSFRHQVSR